MAISFDKSAAVEPTQRTGVHRRHFLKTATVLAGGALLPEMAWAAAAAQCYDLRCDNNKNYITSVKNQDDPIPCNACTAFAVVAMVEGTYNKSQGGPVAGLDLDEMKLFLSGGTHPSGGCGTTHWWPKYALDRCKATGLEWQAPATGPVLKITDFKPLLRPNLNQTQDDIKDWLRTKGPVIAVMVQYEDFYSWGKVWSEQHAGVRNPYVYEPGAELDLCQPVTSAVCQCPQPAASQDASASMRAAAKKLKPATGASVGGHVVCIVGYDDTTSPKSWICKNSWGSEWNGDGYVLIAQGKAGSPNVPKCYIDEIDVYGVWF
jgi:hypothetical protein